jgi:hypothetical protein
LLKPRRAAVGQNGGSVAALHSLNDWPGSQAPNAVHGTNPSTARVRAYAGRLAVSSRVVTRVGVDCREGRLNRRQVASGHAPRVLHRVSVSHAEASVSRCLSRILETRQLSVGHAEASVSRCQSRAPETRRLHGHRTKLTQAMRLPNRLPAHRLLQPSPVQAQSPCRQTKKACRPTSQVSVREHLCV